MEEEKRISEEELKKDVAAAEARIRKTDDFTSPEELYGELIASVKKYHPSDDISLIEKAYRVAADAHKDQKRKSGEPYIIHPLCVAIILADLELDKESIAAGLLHDVVEDTVMTEEELTEEFIMPDPFDPRVADAFALAKAAGVQVDIVWDTTTEVAHPNTVDIRCESREGRTLEMRGVSIGGGAAVIRRINGIDVDITGERTSVVVHQRDERGVLAHIAGVLAGCGINIANANLHRTAKRGDAYTVLETDSAVDASVRELLMDHPDIINARVVPATCAGDGEEVPVPEDAEERFARWDYASGEELLELCERENGTIAQAFRAREEALCAKQGTEAGIDAYLDRVLEVMGNAATEPLGNPQPSVGGLIGGEAEKLASHQASGRGICGDVLEKAITYAVAVLETNASMGLIVASPTAGSAGIVPGLMLAMQEHYHFSDDKIIQALFNASAIGYLAMRNATVAGAVGGCQAEVGVASAMAASAAVELMGGTPKECTYAASTVLMNMLGLVCDPVGGLVEYPCQNRNAAGVANAIIAAEMALAGIPQLIPLDEMIQTMFTVGKKLPAELRETAMGGCAATPSACEACHMCG